MKTLAQPGDKQEMLKRVAALRADSARKWGKMTCHQMICHLSDSFLIGLGEKRASPVKLPIPRAMARFVALYVPLQWPKGIATRPEVEQGIGGTAPADFLGDRKRLVRAIEKFTATQEFSSVAHPMFGEMPAKDWLRWGYLHSDHHLRQFGD